MNYKELFADLSSDERAVLVQMGGANSLTNKRMAARVGISAARVRSVVQGFAERGWAEIGALYSEEDNQLRGRGYILTTEGWLARTILRKGPPPPVRRRDITPAITWLIGFVSGVSSALIVALR